MNLHQLVQSLRDAAVTLDEFVERGHYGRSTRRELAGLLRSCRLLVVELDARAIPSRVLADSPKWVEFMDGLARGRSQLDSQLARLLQFSREAQTEYDLELAILRAARRIREQAEGEFAVLALASSRTGPRLRSTW